ncbi:hypothetical protein SO802_001707 [Lithocarpus litseifolius]|uniref:Aminotransferase class I/classII large domain-containing protein n=1 Tax=Lithocarpus litseifolius TaxID=425828 RepID=A0AAW2DYQ1_9ROSI
MDKDCFEHPKASAPDTLFDVVERYSNDNNKTLKRTTRIRRCLNLGSYNYLGFAASDEYCTPRVIDSLNKYSPSTCSGRVDGGTTVLHKGLKKQVANFLGKQDAIVFGMGYVTNSAILPVLIGKGGLIISDSLNHNSIVNDSMVHEDLEQKFVFSSTTVSLYSICLFNNVHFENKRWSFNNKFIETKMERSYQREKKDWRKCNGKVRDYGEKKSQERLLTWHNNRFTGSNIEKNVELIQYLKYTCPARLYSTSMSPPVAEQIISAIKVFLGEDGTSRVRENSNFLRSELQKMGFEVLGDNDSPVMPIMLYNPAKVIAFSRECLNQIVAVVIVAFPATPLLLGRARICLSASHTKEELVKALEVISQVGDLVGVKYFGAEPKKQQ